MTVSSLGVYSTPNGLYVKSTVITKLITLIGFDTFDGSFWDKINGGLFFTSDINEILLTRTKEVYDGALPSANSVTMHNMIRLARITGDTYLEQKGIKIGKTFSDQITKIPSGYTQMIVGLDFAIGSIIYVYTQENHKMHWKIQKQQRKEKDTADKELVKELIDNTEDRLLGKKKS